MEKLAYLLWRPSDLDAEGWSARLRGPVADALARAGALGVQVNVTDDAVAAAAIRMSTFDAPIEAVVSVWLHTATGDARAAVEAALGAASARLAGYLVTESVPLVAPPTPPGSRTEGLANLAFLRRHPGLDRTQWLERWQGSHTAVAISTQSTFGYVQNVVVRAVTADAPEIDGIVEELFPAAAMTDFHVFFDTGGSDEVLAERMAGMMASVARFSGDDAVLDVAPTSRYVLSSPI
ncbi:EthD domain-containing protein [Aquihabitans sp. G128]|uniref:EthD domain-containing protein n=1 Tax=Aquihabitans sp. G128 TaxID=2849779 RepID=UPI001C226205|nr:EthD domain-containing protein [Aquihabitans sp. G128]QXC61580.1 EthD domain-containing protein [Aquihabitans sp. G128]